MYQRGVRIPVEFNVVDKPKQGRANFHVEIVGRLCDELSTWPVSHQLYQLLEGIFQGFGY